MILPRVLLTLRPYVGTSKQEVICFYDAEGQEQTLSRQAWTERYLLPELQASRNDAEALSYTVEVAVDLGFAKEVLPYSQRLWAIDPLPVRGAYLLAQTYLRLGQLDRARRVLESYLAKYGSNGYILAKLAWVQQRQGEEAESEATYQQALEAEPNQIEALDEYLTRQRELGGDAAALEACQRIAQLPRSWLVGLYLASDALQRQDLARARQHYARVFTGAGCPVATDILQRIGADLLRFGHPGEAVRQVEPHFRAEHGPEVGIHLMQAHLDLGNVERAGRILRHLHALRRPDWRQTLAPWDQKLAHAQQRQQKAQQRQQKAQRRQQKAQRASAPPAPAPGCLRFPGPVWALLRSPFADLPPRIPSYLAATYPKVAVLGSTTCLPRFPPLSQSVRATLTPLSHAVPLLLAEQISLTSGAIATALLPWAPETGFKEVTQAQTDNDLLQRATGNYDFLVAVALETGKARYTFDVRLLRTADGQRLAQASISFPLLHPGPRVLDLCAYIAKQLARHARIAPRDTPPWYQIPSGKDSTLYLLNLERLLVALSAAVPEVEGVELQDADAWLEQCLQLCSRYPRNPTVRIVLAEGLRHVSKIQPHVAQRLRPDIEQLLRRSPLIGILGLRIDAVLQRVVRVTPPEAAPSPGTPAPAPRRSSAPG